MSSSLKEKWNRDSGPAWGSARAGGRGLARRAELERMGAKRCRGTHGDGEGTVVWRAQLARSEVSVAAAGAASTPALPVTPEALPRVFWSPRSAPRAPRLPPPVGPCGTLRTHLACLPSPWPEGGVVPWALVPGLRARPTSDSGPAFPPILTSSWARRKSQSAGCPRGGQGARASRVQGLGHKLGGGTADAANVELGDRTEPGHR